MVNEVVCARRSPFTDYLLESADRCIIDHMQGTLRVEVGLAIRLVLVHQLSRTTHGTLSIRRGADKNHRETKNLREPVVDCIALGIPLISFFAGACLFACQKIAGERTSGPMGPRPLEQRVQAKHHPRDRWSTPLEYHLARRSIFA